MAEFVPDRESPAFGPAVLCHDDRAPGLILVHQQHRFERGDWLLLDGENVELPADILDVEVGGRSGASS